MLTIRSLAWLSSGRTKKQLTETDAAIRLKSETTMVDLGERLKELKERVTP